MATKPRVHEIFGNQALDSTANFRYENQETREKIQLNKKSNKGLAPQPQGMKKFGGYKPKILGGEDDIVHIQNRAAIMAINDTARPAPPQPAEVKSRPAPQPPVQLTKPKPWVVGDKNVPMVLGGRDRHDWAGQEDTDSGHDGSRTDMTAASSSGTDDDAGGLVNSHVQNGLIKTNIDSSVNDILDAKRSISESSVVSETSTLVRSTGSGHEPGGVDNPALGSLDSLAFLDNNNNNGSGEKVINERYRGNIKSDGDTAFGSGQGYINGSYTPPVGDSHLSSSVDSELHLYEPVTDVSGPYIPEPDYDEDEKTLDFNSEDTSDEDGGERRERSNKVPHNGVRPQMGKVFPIPQYEGEDLSHYLSDDEADGLPMYTAFPPPVITNGTAKPKKSGSKKPKNDGYTQRVKLNQNHSLFRDSVPNGYGTKKRKEKPGKNMPPAFNSLRSFSYADSKYGTQGKAAGRNIMHVGGPSKNKVLSAEPEPLDDSDMFLSASTQVSSYESFLRSRLGESMPTESSDSGVEMAEDGPGGGIWKKMTWRLKNRNSKGYSLAEQ